MVEIFMWMWLADVSCVLQILGVFLFVVSIVAIVAAGAIKSVPSYSDEGRKKDRAISKSLTKSSIACLLISFPFFLTPSKTTIHLIAATKAGEIALLTETGSKAVQAVNAVLDDIIANHAKKEK